jgi:hypothetical protein
MHTKINIHQNDPNFPTHVYNSTPVKPSNNLPSWDALLEGCPCTQRGVAQTRGLKQRSGQVVNGDAQIPDSSQAYRNKKKSFFPSHHRLWWWISSLSCSSNHSLHAWYIYPLIQATVTCIWPFPTPIQGFKLIERPLVVVCRYNTIKWWWS